MTSGYGVCRVHDEQFQGITFYLNQARKQMEADMKSKVKKGARPGEKVTASGIFLP